MLHSSINSTNMKALGVQRRTEKSMKIIRLQLCAVHVYEKYVSVVWMHSTLATTTARVHRVTEQTKRFWNVIQNVYKTCPSGYSQKISTISRGRTSEPNVQVLQCFPSWYSSHFNDVWRVAEQYVCRWRMILVSGGPRCVCSLGVYVVRIGKWIIDRQWETNGNDKKPWFKKPRINFFQATWRSIIFGGVILIIVAPQCDHCSASWRMEIQSPLCVFALIFVMLLLLLLLLVCLIFI